MSINKMKKYSIKKIKKAMALLDINFLVWRSDIYKPIGLDDCSINNISLDLLCGLIRSKRYGIFTMNFLDKISLSGFIHLIKLREQCIYYFEFKKACNISINKYTYTDFVFDDILKNLFRCSKYDIFLYTEYSLRKELDDMTAKQFNNKYLKYLEPSYLGLTIEDSLIIRYLDYTFKGLRKKSNFKYREIKLVNGYAKFIAEGVSVEACVLIEGNINCMLKTNTI